MTHTRADIVSLKISHLRLLGNQTLQKLWQETEMLQERAKRNKMNATGRAGNDERIWIAQHADKCADRGLAKGVMGRFGLLQPAVVTSTNETSIARPTIVPMEEMSESRLRVEDSPHPNTLSPLKEQLLEAINSMYHHPDPMGDPNDTDYLFANFSSPKVQRPTPPKKRRSRRKKPSTPGRKMFELDYDGQIFVHNTATCTRPTPVVSVASMNTQSVSVQKLQPVAMEQPLPTVRYGFTTHLSRRTTIHPFQERE